MPDTNFDQTLESLLAYEDAPAGDADEFVSSVMGRVGKERRTRRLILWVFGAIGALFGLLGASLLSNKITWLFTDLLAGDLIMQLPLFAVGIAAFYIWFMNDDMPLER